MTQRKNNIDLVWTISELSSLFERRTNTAEFLQDVVDRIAEHLESEVCSIYLLEEAENRLVLRATHGLTPEAVGTVTLDVGEGITGRAVKELRPIREAHGSKNPHFKLIPGTNEEQYESFLAVPIRRGLNRIGAIVVQQRSSDSFTIHDTRALQAIAAQLANALEHVEIIMELHHRAPDGDRTPRLRTPSPGGERLRCQPASEGVAIGRVAHLNVADHHDYHAADTQAVSLTDEEQRFQAALDRTGQQLEALHRDLDDRLADIASLIFSTHLLMLKDDEFSGEMVQAIRGGRPAHEAIRDVTQKYVDLLSSSANARTKEKTQDIRDLGSRLLRNLGDGDDGPTDLHGRIVIAHELFPSDLVRMAAEHAEGVILTGGGPTAHITILARSLEMPAVFLPEADEAALSEGDLVILDAYDGWIHQSPPAELIDSYRAAAAKRSGAGQRYPARPPVTRDGVTIELLANVNILHDADTALRVGAAGIGLYRSEFPFLLRHDFPSEDEQYTVYRRVADRMPKAPLVLRTLDIGGDKLFSEAQHLEGNPFLGLRGIRFSLAHPEILNEQLRAMLRAGEDRDLRILFPMIASVDEFRRAAEHVARAAEELETDGLPYCTTAKLGVMVELPSAVELVDALAGEADFLSIGSNDLVMYLLGVDRTNEQVGMLYRPFHPAVLRAFARIVRVAGQASCPVSICGEVGADPAMLRFLIGVGLRSVSADPGRLPMIRHTVGDLDSGEAASFAQTLLACTTVEEVDAILSGS